ncbi:MAG: hypothetical protein ASARMPREDX12_006640 [Alectoria sarmentosa]|nr:MAG: hypothetical protein ASARMPRED_001926 [Alectoria sarmentosa]CAD6592988.1 MAG: hypothetical protein ASARMPREDX12_006640 [Alectoria sarmentosa]
MSQDFKTFLAASVLNDGKIVSYRSLGRELKVHCNAAKKMLYEFYSTQTTKKPASINATYLLDGVPRNAKKSSINGHQQDGEEIHMQSSPYMSSSMPHQDDEEEAVPSRSIILAKGEDLEVAKAKFSQIHSVHIYSLGPGRVQNLQILSDCNRAISEKCANEDPLVFQEKYGVIHNAGVKRRTGRRPPIGLQPTPVETINEKARNKSRGTNREQKIAVKSPDRPSSSNKSIKSTPQAAVASDIKAERPRDVEKKPASQPIAAKREQSDIFKSFSRPRAKLKHDDTASSTGASPAPNTAYSQSESLREDEPMKDASDDEQEEDFMSSNSVNRRTSKSQSERAEQLRKMMEDEDEVMEDVGEDAPRVSQESEPVDGPTPRTEISPESPVVATGRRRRGRRKVMKKKTVKDEEGYLVTKEEPAWESFSEDEPPPQREKILPSTATSSMGKGKKPGGKSGQGNIMSFFGKK